MAETSFVMTFTTVLCDETLSDVKAILLKVGLDSGWSWDADNIRTQKNDDLTSISGCIHSLTAPADACILSRIISKKYPDTNFEFSGSLSDDRDMYFISMFAIKYDGTGLWFKEINGEAEDFLDNNSNFDEDDEDYDEDEDEYELDDNQIDEAWDIALKKLSSDNYVLCDSFAIRKMCKYGVLQKHVCELVSLPGNICQGLKFAVTGKLHCFNNREEIENYIKANGGQIAKSITSDTNYLINNDNSSTSAKNTKAKELGVSIISEDEFIQKYGQPF